MTYTYDEVLEASLEYFNGDELAAKVFADKYAMRKKDGKYVEKTPDQMHTRLAKEFARIDSEKYGLNYEDRFAIYYEAMKNFARIVPQGSPMAAVGNTHSVMSASNCVVIPSPEDSMAGIFDTGKALAQLYKRRCGVGISLETLRPEGTSVNNAARTTSGAWSFSDFFSYITRMVGQNSRRGALMLTMDVHHPDIARFITMKHDLTKVTGANVSVKLTDEFLTAVENDEEYEQRWPVEGKAKISQKVRAKDIWDQIVTSATKTAEPGLLFWKNIQDGLPADKYPGYKSISTNPCSEIPLSNDSCRLISHNLTGYVRNAFAKEAYFDFEAFKKDINISMQMIDNLVDIEVELIDRILETCDTEHEKDVWRNLQKFGANGRRTGLGTHGLADTLAQLNIRYDSEEGLEVIDKIYKTLRDTAYSQSIELAKVRGPFPDWNWEYDKKSDFIKRLPKGIKDALRKHGRRNISILTQAPTGSISILSKCGEFNSFNVSSGVEPVFRNSYIRRKKINSKDENARVDYVDGLGDSWQEFKVFHGNVKNFMNIGGISNEDDLPDFFVTSDKIDWKRRVELQAVEQQYIDHAISSTINLPAGTPEEKVAEIYMHAWKSKLKGITVYVDGSRDGVLVTQNSSSNTDTDGRPTQIVHTESPKRPDSLPCEIHHVTVKGTPWVVLLGMLGEDPYEIFAGHSEDLTLPKKYQLGRIVKEKKGHYSLHVDTGDDEELVVTNIVKTFNNPESSWATRMISMALRHGSSPEFVVDQLSKDGGIGDINKVLSRIFKKFIKNGAKVKVSKVCGECGSDSLVYIEGCESCTNCGWSKC